MLKSLKLQQNEAAAAAVVKNVGTGIDSGENYMPAIIRSKKGQSREMSSEMVAKSIDRVSARSESLNKLRKNNISLEILRKRQLGIVDPLSNVGIMSLNNKNLPYKKPILKQIPGIYVNTRGVI